MLYVAHGMGQLDQVQTVVTALLIRARDVRANGHISVMIMTQSFRWPWLSSKRRARRLLLLLSLHRSQAARSSV